MSDKPEKGYQVGYGKPPMKSRFGKGQSGNPTGKRRPKDEAEQVRRLLRQEVFRALAVREGDSVTRMPAIQAVVRGQIASAAKGSVPAQRAVIKLAQEVVGPAKECRAQAAAGNGTAKDDINDVSDEKLWAIVNAAAKDSTG